MTKKDYELIANEINKDFYTWRRPSIIEKEGMFAIINAVANALEKDNPRFDRERFIEACTA